MTNFVLFQATIDVVLDMEWSVNTTKEITYVHTLGHSNTIYYCGISSYIEKYIRKCKMLVHHTLPKFEENAKTVKLVIEALITTTKIIKITS